MSKNVDTVSLFKLIDAYVNSKKEIWKVLELERRGDLIGPLGEHVGASALQLDLNTNQNEKGFDGFGKDGKKYQIKSRTFSDDSFTIPQFDFRCLDEKNFDYFVGIIFDQEYRVSKAYQAPWEFVYSNKGNLNKQNAHLISVAKFNKSVGRNGCIDITKTIRAAWR